MSDVGYLKHDITRYAKYEEKRYTVALYKYDAATNEYSLYKELELLGGKKLSELGENLEAIKVADNADGTTGVSNVKFLALHDLKTAGAEDYMYLTGDSLCVRSLNIYPVFSRRVDVVFDAGDGKIITENGLVSQVDYYAESKLNYKIDDFPLVCVKDLDDPKFRYEHVGWENQVTKERIYRTESLR